MGDAEAEPANRLLSRRSVLKLMGAGVAGAGLASVADLAFVPQREALAAPPAQPDIQFDIGGHIAPGYTVDGVRVRFGPVFTLFLTAKLARDPSLYDRDELARALDDIERHYRFAPEGVFMFVAYGLPYFARFPGGYDGDVIRRHMPRLSHDTRRSAFEEAVPAPTDVSASNPGISKARFNVPVAIEDNDMLITLRSDRLENLHDVAGWLSGGHWLRGESRRSPEISRLLRVTSRRLMFQQPGLPRKVAEQHGLAYADRIHPQSPMWMGFADQQVSGAGPAPITTFQGSASARVTTARAGDYMDNASVQHLSHVILDLAQFYADDEPYTERVQYMFRSNPVPSEGNGDQYADGGGPAFLENTFQGRHDADANARAAGTYGGERRMGHLSALQRSSRAADGTPMHIRMDGSGFDSLDIPDRSAQPKLQFTGFFPSSAFFADMRRNQAALDLVKRYGVAGEDNGLERFTTATRRQNFLVPPRRHRAFPLLEFAYGSMRRDGERGWMS